MKTDPISAAQHYRRALEEITRASSVATAVQTARRALETTFAEPEKDDIGVSTGFGHRTRVPFVTLTTSSPAMQMTVDKAREVAWMISGAADASLSDAFLITFLTEVGGFDMEQIGKTIAAFRAFREKQEPPSATSA